MITLRPYQEKAINDIRNSFASNHRRIILQAPTGAGKTIMFTYIAKSAIERGRRVMIITDRVELLRQTGGALGAFGLIADSITAKTKRVRKHHLYISMLETLSRRSKNVNYQRIMSQIDLFILDEAHKNSFNKLFPLFPVDAYVIGATATPIRFGKQPQLSNFYNKIISTANIKDLIEQEYLTPSRSFGVTVDLSSVRVQGGEFRPDDLTRVYQENKLYSGVVKNYIKHTPGSKTLVFSASVENSKSVCDEFLNNDIDARHLDATTKKQDRAKILEDFRNGVFPVLCNVGILTTGFDDPTIKTIILYRATKSLPLFLQMCGRGSRISEGKNEFNILDFGNNIKRHGFWQQSREWSLTHDHTKKKIKENTINVKYCPKCDSLISDRLRICPHCGYEFYKKIANQEVELEELSYSAIKFIEDSLTVMELEHIRRAKGYKVGWILHRLKKRNVEAWREYAQLKGYNPKWVSINYHRYKTLPKMEGITA